MLVLAVALFFVFPWLPEPSPAGAALERDSPEHDGGSLLIENYDADGGLISTESQNLAVIPDLRAFTESRQALADELEKVYDSPENMEDAQVVEVRRRTLEGSGGVSNTTDTLAVDSRGLLLLGSREGDAGTDLVFDRPAVLLPADLGPDKSWSSEGKAGSLHYELDGCVVGAGPSKGELGDFDDCFTVRTQLILSQPGHPDEETGFRDTYCAGVGLAESRQFDGSGKMTRRSTFVSTDQAPAEHAANLRPVGRIYFGATDKKLYALHARGLFLRAFETRDNAASRPVVAGDTLVFGSENRNVYGLDADTGEVRWRAHTGDRWSPRRRSLAGWW